MPLEDFTQGLQDTFKQYWKPGLAGAALGGTAAGYLSRDAGEPGELPSARRKRMLRNALLGALLGGTAGVGIPAGAATVSEPWSDAKTLAGGPIDSALGFTGAHAVPAAVAGMGGAAVYRSARGNRADAAKQLVETLKNEIVPQGTLGIGDASSPEALRAALSADPKRVDSLHAALSHTAGKIDPKKSLRMQELMSEAGFRPTAEKSVGQNLANLFTRAGAGHGLVSHPKALKDYLATEGGLPSRVMSKLVGAKRIPVTTGKATFNPEVIPEIWRQLVRPSIKGRLPMAGKLGLLGGAVMAGQSLQDRLTGN